jgi:WD40 repeat protein
VKLYGGRGISGLAWSIVLVAVACGFPYAREMPRPAVVRPSTDTPAPTPNAPAPPGVACTQWNLAVALRSAAHRALFEGRLDRARRALNEANALCPAEAVKSWRDEVVVLAELDDYEGARVLADRVDQEGDDEAKGAAATARALIAERKRAFTEDDVTKHRWFFQHAVSELDAGRTAVARDLFLRAWTSLHPNGQALLGAALASEALGNAADTQRLFDRAVADLEREAEARAESEGEAPPSHTAVEIMLDRPRPLGTVSGLAWSPDGRQLAASDGGAIVVVDSQTWRNQYRIEDGGDVVRAFGYSADGKLIISGGADGRARLWNARAGRSVASFRGHGGSVNAVALSADERRLAVGFSDGTVQLWDVRDAVLHSTFEGDGVAVTALTMSPDGDFVASGGEGGTILITSLREGGGVKTLRGHVAPIQAMAFSRDGKLLESTSADKTVRTWDVETGEQARSFLASKDVISPDAFSPDGRFLATSSFDTIDVWSVDSGRLRGVFRGHTDAVRAIAFTPDGRFIASSAFDHTIRIWDVARAVERKRVQGAAGRVLCALAPGGENLLVGSPDGRISLLSSTSGRWRALAAQPEAVTAMAWSPDGNALATASQGDQAIRIWDEKTGALLETLRGDGKLITGIAFSPDGHTLASASERNVVLWDLSHSTSSPIADEGAAAVAFAPTGDRLAVAGRDFVIWDVTMRAALERVAGADATAVTFSAAGNVVAWGAKNGDLVLWTAGDSPKTVRPSFSRVNALAISREGATAVAADADGSLHIVHVADGSMVRSWAGQSAAFSSVGFWGSGATIVTGSSDGMIRLWNTADGSELASIGLAPGHDAAFIAAREPAAVELLGDVAAAERIAPNCRIGLRTYPLKLCLERFAVSDLVRRVLERDTSYAEPL